ncbi:phosphate-starvation-inducible E [Thalassococcus profundi]|uniref:Protein PsiE n=2 Tax=Thalassococcus profundi TaxID=2282382 RepID=A0A369TKM6_9RHOB|nr:phosphate-starvation-inducible E [Thalassococcus profundi]
MEKKQITVAESQSDEDLDTSGLLAGPDVGNTEKKMTIGLLHLIERLLMLVVVLMTIGGAISEILTVYKAQTINLADILLMFLYAEVISMVAVFYADRKSVFVYPIFIAITALARLVILQGKEMAPENILFEAAAILLLTFAALVIVHVRKSSSS